MYQIAIPSYKRHDMLQEKTLKMLQEGKVEASCITIFVVNKEEKDIYSKTIDENLYNKIVIGEIGRTNQRNFIKKYYDVGDYVVSLDDDLEYISRMHLNNTLSKVEDLDMFFTTNYELLLKRGLFLWGLYPVHNQFFMRSTFETRDDLRFIIGLCHGFIVREDRLLLSPYAESKEDVEQTILYYIKDGGVLRLEKYSAKTNVYNKKEQAKTWDIREKPARNAAVYIMETYPEFAKVWVRKTGIAEVKLRDTRLSNYLPILL